MRASLPILLAAVVAALTVWLWWRRGWEIPRVAIAFRLLSIAAVVVAAWNLMVVLERPAATRPRLAVVLDRSASVADDTLHRMLLRAREMVDRHPEAEVAAFPFGGGSESTAAVPFDGSGLAVRSSADDPASQRSDAGPAIRAARAWVASASSGRAVLLSDGRLTQDPRLPVAQPVPVDALLVDAPSARAWISDFIASRRAEPDTDLVLTVRVEGTASGKLVLHHAGKPVACRETGALDAPPLPGQSVVCTVSTADASKWGSGLHQLAARLQGQKGAVETFVHIGPRNGPLLVGVPAADEPFWRAVFAPTLVPWSGGIPVLERSLAGGDVPAVVLQPGALRIGAKLNERLTQYTRTGGILIVVNGDDRSGKGLDAVSVPPLSERLPLRPLTDEELNGPVVLAAALDRSVSVTLAEVRMGRDLIAGTVRTLRPRDRTILYWFNSRFQRVPLDIVSSDPASDATAVSEALTLEPSGGTDLCRVMNRIVDDLEVQKKKTKVEAAGTLFVVTDSDADSCILEWEKAEKRTQSRYAKLKARLSDLRLRLYMVIMDAERRATRKDGGGAHTMYRKNLQLGEDGHLRYGPIRVYQVCSSACAAVRTRPAVTAERFVGDRFHPECWAGAQGECRRYFGESVLPQHVGYLRCEARDRFARVLLVATDKETTRHAPVMAVRGDYRSGVVMAIATDPAGAYRNVPDPKRKQALARFYGASLAQQLGGKLGRDYRVTIDSALGPDAGDEYTLRLHARSAAGATGLTGIEGLTLSLRDARGTERARRPMDRHQGVWKAALPRAAVRGCPCRLHFAATPARSGPGWPPVRLFADPVQPSPLNVELSGVADARAALDQLVASSGGRQITGDDALLFGEQSAPAPSGREVPWAAALFIALGALLADVAIRRRG